MLCENCRIVSFHFSGKYDDRERLGLAARLVRDGSGGDWSAYHGCCLNSEKNNFIPYILPKSSVVTDMLC